MYYFGCNIFSNTPMDGREEPWEGGRVDSRITRAEGKFGRGAERVAALFLRGEALFTG
jgi:hypothetical protein